MLAAVNINSLASHQILLEDPCRAAVRRRHFKDQLRNSLSPRRGALTNDRCTSMSFLSRATVAIRPYRLSDRPIVFRLLSVLPSLYPGGASWLDHRLDDVLGGKARCTIAVTNGAPVGITIETPKEPHKFKLSTIYVCPSFRGLGIGTRLLRQCRENWLRGDIDQVSVTADVRRTDTLLRLFTTFGFRAISVDRGRYGPDRDEMVFIWRPEEQ